MGEKMAQATAGAAAGPFAAAAAAPAKKEYRRGIDLLRFVAAAGIVADHCMGWAWIGYPALGLFLILTSYFSVGSYLRSGGDGFWSSRAVRMLTPWLFWCVVYRVLWEVVSDEPFRLLSDPFTLLIGPSVHLWFLPFAMLALFLIPAIARDVTTRERLVVASAGLAVVAVVLGLIHAKSGLAGWVIPGGLDVPQPIPQWAFSLPIYLWGALAAVAHRMGATAIPLVAAAVGSAVLTALDFDQASWQLILSALVFEAVWRWKGGGAWMTALAGYAFGIYLMHPAFMLVGYKIFGAGMNLQVGFLISFFGSWAATLAFKRLPVLNRMV